MVRVKTWASLKVIARTKDTSSGVVMVRGRDESRTRTRITISAKGRFRDMIRVRFRIVLLPMRLDPGGPT